MMKTLVHGFAASTTWAKILMVVSLGKAFVAGAGLGLAALGVVDVAGQLGVRPIIDIIQRDHILDVFAYGGGIIATVFQIVWKIVTR